MRALLAVVVFALGCGSEAEPVCAPDESPVEIEGEWFCHRPPQARERRIFLHGRDGTVQVYGPEVSPIWEAESGEWEGYEENDDE